MPKALRDVNISFFWFYRSCYYINFIVFIKSMETEASLLALAKSIYYVCMYMYVCWEKEAVSFLFVFFFFFNFCENLFIPFT